MFRVDMEEGGYFPDRWFCWGFVLPWLKYPKEAQHCMPRLYLRVKLPSYQYGPEYESWNRVTVWAWRQATIILTLNIWTNRFEFRKGFFWFKLRKGYEIAIVGDRTQ